MRPSRVSLLLLLPLLALPLFCTACGEDAPPAETAAVSEESPVGGIHIAAGEKTDYMVIRGDYCEDAITKSAVKLRSGIEDTLGSTGPGISTDWEKSPVYPHELIVGPTQRPGDADIDRLALGESGYLIREVDGCVYLCGGSAKGTALAVSYFLDNFVSKDGVDVPAGFEYIVYHEYDIPALYINMHPVEKDAVIAIPDTMDPTWKKAAERLQEFLYRKTGVYPAIKTGDKGTFVLSDAASDYAGADEITLSADGSGLVFRTSASGGIANCIEAFINEYLRNSYGCYNFPADFHYLQAGESIIIRYPKEG